MYVKYALNNFKSAEQISPFTTFTSPFTMFTTLSFSFNYFQLYPHNVHKIDLIFKL